MSKDTVTVELTKAETDLIYYQLLARKEYFLDEMVVYAEKRDLKEVKRCHGAIDQIEKILNKLINAKG